MKKQLFLLFALPMLWGLIGCAEEEPVVTPSPYPDPGPETEYQELGCMTFTTWGEMHNYGYDEQYSIDEQGVLASIYWLYNDCGDFVVRDEEITLPIRLVVEQGNPNLRLREYYQVDENGWGVLTNSIDESGNHTGNLIMLSGHVFGYDYCVQLFLYVPETGDYKFRMELYDPTTGIYYTTDSYYYRMKINGEPNEFGKIDCMEQVYQTFE